MWRQDVAITPDGWFDWMRRKPGPPDKVYSQRNAVDFYVALRRRLLRRLG